MEKRNKKKESVRRNAGKKTLRILCAYVCVFALLGSNQLVWAQNVGMDGAQPDAAVVQEENIQTEEGLLSDDSLDENIQKDDSVKPAEGNDDDAKQQDFAGGEVSAGAILEEDEFELGEPIAMKPIVEASFAGGDGTEANPYQIANSDQMVYFEQLINAGSSFEGANGETVYYSDCAYELTGDIDLNGITWKPVGTSNVEHRYFAGSFDGNGHAVSGFTMESAVGTYDVYGLFGYVGGKNLTIKNLTLRNAGVYMTGVESPESTEYNIGMLAGCVAGGDIHNVTVSGSLYISGADIDANMGAIAGKVISETPFVMYNCGNQINMIFSTKASSEINHENNGVGGMIGKCQNPDLTIKNCFNAGSIISTDKKMAVAGIIGNTSDASGIKLYNVFNSAILYASTDTSYIGAIVSDFSGVDAAESIYYSKGVNSQYGAGANIENSQYEAPSEMQYYEAQPALNKWVMNNYTEKMPFYTWSDDRVEFGREPVLPEFPSPTLPSKVEYVIGQNIESDDLINASCSVSDGGTVTYQWYSCDAEGNGETAVENLLNPPGSSVLRIDTASPCNEYYYVMVTNTKQDGGNIMTASFKSAPVHVVVGNMIKFVNNDEGVTGDIPGEMGPVIPGTAVALPENRLNKENMVFAGWSYDGGKHVFAPGSTFVMPEDARDTVVLTAQWIDIQHLDVRFTSQAADSEKISSDEGKYSIVAASGSVIKLPEGDELFKYNDFRFMGWRLANEEETFELYKSGDDFTMPEEDVTFVAVWSRLHSATYNAGVKGIDTSALPEDTQYAVNEVFTLPACKLLYTGYAFKGWKISYSNMEGENKTVILPAGSEYTMPSSDITITAQWRSRVSISFENNADADNGLKVTGSLPDKIFGYAGQTKVQLPDKGNLSVPGYTFAGWYDVDFDSLYKENETISLDYNMILAAKWGKNCNVSFGNDLEGVTGSTPSDIKSYEGNEIKIPESTLTAPEASENNHSWQFIGWEDSEGNIYKPGSTYTATGEDIEFTAKWQYVKDWMSEAAENFAGGDGSMENPYQISKIAELAKLLDEEELADSDGYAGVYFVLTDNIFINGQWIPIAPSKDHPFKGHFDGASNGVYGLEITNNAPGEFNYLGLFGCLGEGAEVKGISLEKVYIDYYGNSESASDNELFAGALAGNADKAAVSECEASGSVTIHPSEAAAGNVINEAAAAGLIGSIEGSNGETPNISSCSTSVKVNVDNSHDSVCIAAGGIAGKALDQASISECKNSGDVKTEASDVYKNHLSSKSLSSAAGGIVGCTDGKVSDSSNSGNVSHTGIANMWIGGIAGQSKGELISSENQGNISMDADSKGAESSSATVSGDGEGVSLIDPYADGNGAGGVTGYSYGLIRECSNRGMVTIQNSVDCGDNDNDGVMSMAGGVAGGACDLNGSGSGIFDSYNAGDIDVKMTGHSDVIEAGDNTHKNSGAFIGGIVGLAGIDASDANNKEYSEPAYGTNYGLDIKYVHNYGVITGLNNNASRGGILGVGAIVGRSASSTTVENAYYQEESSGGYGICGISSSDFSADSTCEGYSDNIFRSGKVAYLLNGEEESRQKWKQGTSAYPVFGQGILAPVEAPPEVEGGTIGLSNMSGASDIPTLYASSGDTIKVTAEPDSDNRVVINEWIEATPVLSGVVYTTYSTYEGYTVESIEISDNEGAVPLSAANNTFVMRNGGTQVDVNFAVDRVTEAVNTSFVPKGTVAPDTSNPPSSAGSNASTGIGHANNVDYEVPVVDPGNNQSPLGGGFVGNHNSNSNGNGTGHGGISGISDSVSGSLNGSSANDDLLQGIVSMLQNLKGSSSGSNHGKQSAAAAAGSAIGGTSDESLITALNDISDKIQSLSLLKKTVQNNPFVGMFIMIAILATVWFGGRRKSVKYPYHPDNSPTNFQHQSK